MDESQIKDIIERSLAGKATPEELSLLEQWYNSFDKNESLTEQLNDHQKAQTANRMLEGIRYSIDGDTVAFRKKSGIIRYRPIMIAASVIILLGLAVATYLLIIPSKKTAAPLSETIKVDGQADQVTRTALPDGSTIWINGAGSIRHQRDFVKDTREVWLEGEAYFAVSSDKTHPFIVHAGKLNVNVVGTEFNIRMNGADSGTVVTVTKGKVSVEADKKILGVLGVNEEISYKSQNGEHTQKQVVTDQAIAWKTGALVFRDTEFSEVAAKLEKRFGIDIQFRDPGIEKCELTASFDSTLNGEQILSMLCRINGSKLTKEKEQYIISGKPCN